ncbi:FecR family protein [Lutibacter aestuarii]|uniref:FecR family protein n=1 Tax=Lutibacter aestuarii TaxID=861111 RepID=A0ABW2Z2R0_9FLAO
MEFKLIIKKLNKTLTDQEKVIFNTWYNESEKHRVYFNHVAKNYSKDLNIIDLKKGWSQIEKQIKPVSTFTKNNYWKYTAVAASILLLISITFNFNKNKTIELESKIINPEIKAGSDKATLTLANGSKINLEKGKNIKTTNAESNGEKIVYKKLNEIQSPEITYNYLTVPRGGQFFIELADNTKVWLNSESQLKYPVNFIEDETRKVELVYGEAYFEVSPSTKHNGASFIVQSKMQDVEVLGTEFNIKAYKDEAFSYTTLTEGKVAIKTKYNTKILKPNQQAIVDSKSKTINIKTVAVYNDISWKDGIFSFDHMPLNKIVKVLSRWYDIDIEFENEEIETIAFNGILRKNQPLEDILTTIKNTNNINYKIDNKTIIFN